MTSALASLTFVFTAATFSSTFMSDSSDSDAETVVAGDADVIGAGDALDLAPARPSLRVVDGALPRGAARLLLASAATPVAADVDCVGVPAGAGDDGDDPTVPSTPAAVVAVVVGCWRRAALAPLFVAAAGDAPADVDVAGVVVTAGVGMTAGVGAAVVAVVAVAGTAAVVADGIFEDSAWAVPPASRRPLARA